MKKWKTVFLCINWKPKGSMTLKCVEVFTHKSKEAALGNIYNRHNLPYMKKLKDSFVLWYGNPSYGYHDYRFAIISLCDTTDISIDSRTNDFKRRMKQIMTEMFLDWNNKEGNIYTDNSIYLSDLHWQTTIPKGYKLLRVGSTIKDTDMEYDDISSTRRSWGKVSWYNVDKKVEKSQAMRHVKTNKQGKQYTYRTHPGYPSPLIIRKIA